jgi:hypothetical protein
MRATALQRQRDGGQRGGWVKNGRRRGGGVKSPRVCKRYWGRGGCSGFSVRGRAHAWGPSLCRQLKLLKAGRQSTSGPAYHRGPEQHRTRLSSLLCCGTTVTVCCTCTSLLPHGKQPATDASQIASASCARSGIEDRLDSRSDQSHVMGKVALPPRLGLRVVFTAAVTSTLAVQRSSCATGLSLVTTHCASPTAQPLSEVTSIPARPPIEELGPTAIR